MNLKEGDKLLCKNDFPAFSNIRYKAGEYYKIKFIIADNYVQLVDNKPGTFLFFISETTKSYPPDKVSKCLWDYFYTTKEILYYERN